MDRDRQSRGKGAAGLLAVLGAAIAGSGSARSPDLTESDTRFNLQLASRASGTLTALRDENAAR